MTTSHKRGPTIITSNNSHGNCASLFPDVSLAAAIIDRLVHHGQVFYLKGPSSRLKGHHTEEARSEPRPEETTPTEPEASA